MLQNERDASGYRILVKIADSQPAVNQPDVAEEIGPSVQRVNVYFRDSVEQGYVEKLGQGRYTLTREGFDRLVAQTESLAGFTEYVSISSTGLTFMRAARVLQPGDVL